MITSASYILRKLDMCRCYCIASRCRALCDRLLRATFNAINYRLFLEPSFFPRVTHSAAVRVALCGGLVRQPQPIIVPRYFGLLLF